MPDLGNEHSEEYSEQNAVPAQQVRPEAVATRSDLLPEETTVGSEDPRAQAEAILRESEARVEDPDAGI